MKLLPTLRATATQQPAPGDGEQFFLAAFHFPRVARKLDENSLEIRDLFDVAADLHVIATLQRLLLQYTKGYDIYLHWREVLSSPSVQLVHWTTKLKDSQASVSIPRAFIRRSSLAELTQNGPTMETGARAIRFDRHSVRLQPKSELVR